MKDMNTIALTGRLTKDPELRATNGGTAVTTLRVAIQRPNGPEAQDRGAAFIDVEAWKGTAEACCKFLKKGSRVAVEGFLEQDEWKKDGASRQRHYVVAKPGGIQFLDGARTAPEAERDEAPAEDPEPGIEEAA
jgi:single-strand DNA-binding protein